VKIEAKALDTLAAIGEKTSLRFAVQLLTPAKILAETEGQDTIRAADVTAANALFIDAKVRLCVAAASVRFPSISFLGLFLCSHRP
jgi:RuvB-like protein 1 (pontin 52)